MSDRQLLPADLKRIEERHDAMTSNGGTICEQTLAEIHADRGLLLAAVRFYESERTYLADSRREQGELAIKAETERDEALRAFGEAQNTIRKMQFRIDRDDSGVTIHECPPHGSAIMPCCGKTPFEVLADRMTQQPELVNCDRVRLKSELSQAACVIRDQNRRTAMIEREALAERVTADKAKTEAQRRGLMLDAISKIVCSAGWPMKTGDDEVSQTRRAVKAMKDAAVGQQKRANKLDTEFLRLQTDYLRAVEKIISLEQGIKLYRAILHPCERPAGQDSTAARVASDEWTAEHAKLNHVPRWTPPTCVHGTALSAWCDKCHDDSMGNRVIKNTAPDPWEGPRP